MRFCYRNYLFSPLDALFVASTSLAIFHCDSHAEGSIFSPRIASLIRNEKLHDNATNKTRIHNVDVVLDEKGEEIGICHVPIFLPISDLDAETGKILPYIDLDTFQSIGAAFLAMQHLNAGDGRIIKEVEGLNERCNIRFTPEVHDSQLSESHTVNQVIDVVSRDPEQEKLPCAFLGSYRSAVSIPLSIITGLKGYPQLSPLSTSAQLNNKNQFPLFGRLVPSDDGTAIPLVRFLQQIDVKQGLAVLHTNDVYGNYYALGVKEMAAELCPTLNIKLVGIPFDLTPEIVTKKVGLLRDTQFRYFFGVIFGVKHYEPIMVEAYKQGIAGTGLHNWMFGDGLGINTFKEKVYERDSPLHLVTRGISMITAVGGMAGQRIYDEFITAFGELNNHDDLGYIRSKLPSYDNSPEYSDYVSNLTMDGVGIMSGFLYDSTIALGLAACNVTQPDIYFDGKEHYKAVLESTFKGVAGTVDLDRNTGTRTPNSALFSIFNFVEDDSEGPTLKIPPIVSDIFEDGQWRNVNPFVFNDGTTTPALDLPEQIVDYHYLTNGLYAVGITMAVLIFMLSVLFAAWTFRNKNSRVIKASQPIFLHLVCAGTFLMGSSIIPLGIDDHMTSIRGCDIACMAFPWLASTGFAIAFSALFTKTYRVNKIFHTKNFTRVKISALDVMKPMLAHLGVNSIILLLFNVLDPLRWTREVVATDTFGRDMESEGYCASDNSTSFLAPLACVNLGALCVGLYQAYVARHISTEFAESEYIGLAMLILLLVSFIGLPVVFLVGAEPRAYFFVLSGIIFIGSVSLLLLIFVPKMMSLNKNKGDGGKGYSDVIQETNQRIKKHSHSNASYQSHPPPRDIAEQSSYIPSYRAHYDSEEGGQVERDDIIKKRIISPENSSHSHASYDSEDSGMKIFHRQAHFQKMKHENQSLRHLTNKLEDQITRLETINSSRKLVVENETNGESDDEESVEGDSLRSTLDSTGAT